MKIYQYQTGPIFVNTYLVSDEQGEGFIVDPGGFDPAILRKAAEEGIHVGWILLTHGHGDHIGGVADFRQVWPDAKVAASELEKRTLEDPRFNSSPSINGREIREKADLLVKDGETLTIGTIEVKFLSTPGHTEGGQCIYIEKEKICFCGDTLFECSVGRTDFPGGNYQQLIDSIRTKLFTLPDDTVCLPGHMGHTQIGYEKENNPFVN